MFEILIKTFYIPLCAAEHSIRFICFFPSLMPQNLMLECLHFSPTAGSLDGDE